MAQVVENCRRIRITNEAAGAFGVEQLLASFVNLFAREDSVKLMLNEPQETPMLLQQHVDGYPIKVNLPKTAQLDFKANLSAFNVRSTVTPHVLTAQPEHLLWLISMGGSLQVTGNTVASAASTTSITLTNAVSAGVAEGCVVAFPTGPGGALEARVVKTLSGNVITLKLALSAVPTPGMVMYGGVTYYLDNTSGATVQSLQAAYEGLDDNDRYLLKGGQLAAPMSFELGPGTVPQVTWSWMFADHDYADGIQTTMNLTTTPIADQNLASTGINAVMDSAFIVRPNAGSTLIGIVDASSITITPNVKYVAHKTPGGVNTVKQWVRMRPDGPAVVGDFLVPHDDRSWFDVLAAKTSHMLSFQIGSTVAGGCVLIDVPNVIIEDVQRESVDGIAGVRVKWYARLDQATTSNTSNLQKSALRVARF